MATIIKRGDRHLARVRKLGFSPVSQSFIRKSDAIAWGRRVEADMEGGRWSDSANAVPTLKDAIADYRIKVAVRLKGARDYGYSFKEIEAAPIGSRKIDELKPGGAGRRRQAPAAACCRRRPGLSPVRRTGGGGGEDRLRVAWG